LNEKSMKAFLLTAGLGTRLRPLTDKTPKCLLPINGKPLLQIWIEILSRYDVDQVLINTHWHHEKVEAFVKQRVNDLTPHYHLPDCPDTSGELRGRLGKEGGTWPEVKLFYEPELLGSAGTLLANKDWVADKQPFFILYGDTLTNLDLRQMYDFHCRSSLPVSLGVFKADEPERCGIVKIDKNGLVVDFVEKPENPKSNVAAAGIFVADQRLFDFYPQNAESIRPLDLGFHVIPRLVRNMKAYIIEEFLIDIGTPESYEKAQTIWPQIKYLMQRR